MTFTPDKAIEMCLTTWYPVDNPLHFDSRHPCIKLAGEAGEILDNFGKEEYKPNWSWWDCTKCGKSKGHDNHLGSLSECNYVPKVLDELGDYSYYLRILAYQKEITFEELCNALKPINRSYIAMDILLSELSLISSELLNQCVLSDYRVVSRNRLQLITNLFLAILHKLDCTLDNLLDLNYKKLNTESQHGWRHASIKS